MSTSSWTSWGSDDTATTSNVHRNMALNLPAPKEKFFDKCPRCRINFDFLKRVNVTKVPLVLTCKHTVCEDCIKRMCLQNNMVCPVCKEEFEVAKTQLDNLTAVFPPHYTLIGRLVWMKNGGSTPKTEFNMVSTGYTLKNKMSGVELPELEIDGKSDVSEEDSEKMSLVFDQCNEHSDQYLNLRCEDCDGLYCCYCFLENHAGHRVAYLYKLSEEETTELEKLRTDLELVLAQLLRSKKKSRDIKTFDTSDVEQDIKLYFSNLHAKLHIAERNIQEKLSHLETDAGDINSINFLLRSRIQKVKSLVDHFRLKSSTKLNVRALYEEAQTVKDIPCRLVSDQVTLRPVEFVSTNLFDDLEDHIFVKSTPPIEYSLVPIEDWTEAQEKYQLDQIKKSLEIHHQDRHLCSVASTTEASRSSFDSRPKKAPSEGKIRVLVTHINSLNSFFIQKYNALDTLKEMNNIVAKRPRRKDRNADFKIGGVYGVAYETKQKVYWRRGKLLDFTHKESGIEYKVFFIDYGNTHTVTRDKIKELDLHTVRRPPFSYECSLHNPDEVVFDENAHLRLPQFIGHKELFLRFMNSQTERSRAYEVELWVAASNGGCVLVRDLLLTKTLFAAPERKETGLTSELRLFENSKKFTVGQEVYVMITHIKDPHYICVQLADNLSIIEKMQEEMTKYYKDKSDINCIPVVDSYVIVKYSDKKHGEYHRGKITSVDIASKEVGVFFVDCGKIAFVSWSSLRMLKEDFIKVECQGIIVKLADVEKLKHDEPWREETVTLMREFLASDHRYKIIFSRVEPLEVALFQSTPSADICWNSWLVEKKFAMSTGAISETVYWPTDLAEPQEDEDDEGDLAAQMIKKSQEVLLEDPDVQVTMGVHSQVRIVNFQHPGLIYFKFMKYETTEDEMHQELQIHYSSKQNKTKSSWKVGEYCVVYDKVRLKYFRAIIKSESSRDHYIVYLYDEVRELKMNKKAIYVQDQYFMTFACHVIKCRLSNIKPAGGVTKWSQLAVEMLQKIFRGYKTLHVKKVEMNRDDKILGVVMWYCMTIGAKALEPAKIKFVSVNQSLVESGVAFSGNSLAKNGSKVDWFEIVCQDEKNEKESEDEDNKDKNNEKTEVKNEDEISATCQKGWLDPPKITELEFDATLTCVCDKGYFWVRDENMQQCYLALEKSLTEKINSMEIPDDEEPNWQKHDMCTVFYEDKCYRGIVLEVRDTGIVSVEMIDFGSAHEVEVKDLTRGIMFTDVEPLVYRVQLHDVYPKNEKFTVDDINMLLELVTDQVKITVKGDLDLAVPFAEIYLDYGMSLNDVVIERCPNMIRKKHSVKNTRKTSPQVKKDSNKVHFNYVIRLRISKEKHKLFAVAIVKWNLSYNVVLSTKEDTTSSAEFVMFSDMIQEQALQQTVLRNIDVGLSCLCIQPDKKVWGRAVVHNISSLNFGYVLVFFVDYGTLDMISASEVRAIRDEWLDVPVYMQIASIGIDLVQSYHAENVLIHLNNLRRKWILVEVVSESPLIVQLFENEDDLCYKNLVESGIVKALS